jgi:hypothetical protein
MWCISLIVQTHGAVTNASNHRDRVTMTHALIEASTDWQMQHKGCYSRQNSTGTVLARLAS